MSTAVGTLFEAKLTAECKRYDDLLEIMKNIYLTMSCSNTKFTEEERDLFLIAYRMKIAKLLFSWRVLSNYQKTMLKNPIKLLAQLVKAKHAALEQDIRQLCCEVLSVLEKHRFPTDTLENRIINIKARADFHQSLAEVCNSEVQKEKALQAYTNATDMAKLQLSPAHPLRLQLFSDFAEFYYKVRKLPKLAIQLLRTELNKAASLMNGESTYQCSKSHELVQQLMRNVDEWETNKNDAKENSLPFEPLLSRDEFKNKTMLWLL